MQQIKYTSLGTFEFLANPSTHEYFFLEINPRLQVEHTITESISLTDLVYIQLSIAQGTALSTLILPALPSAPSLHSIQLRITAENVQSNWSLSIGKITQFQFPHGNGIRVDTHLLTDYQTVVSADFDSLIAKLIVTASTWDLAVHKARRALAETNISGVHTNLDVLRAIVARPEFLNGQCDTQWLEGQQTSLLEEGRRISNVAAAKTTLVQSNQTSTAALTASNLLFRKGDAWTLKISPPGKKADAQQPPHHLSITRVLRNEFPTSLAAEVLFTIPSTNAASGPQQIPYALELSSTSASSSSVTSSHRRGDPGDPTHVVIPFPGKLVEVLVDEGDVLREGDVVCVVQQMKMELEVRAPRSGTVAWVLEVEDGEEVAEGTLACIVKKDEGARL